VCGVAGAVARWVGDAVADVAGFGCSEEAHCVLERV
jgi:hypothetical protein